MRTSYSALATYQQCPQKYKYQEIDRIKAPKNKEAVFGTLVHEALKFMFSRDPLFPTLEEVLAKFREGLTQTHAIMNTDKERFRELGESMLTKFWKKNPPWNFSIIDLESHFEIALPDIKYKETHILVGKIDRIDKTSEGDYEVIDYKTTRRLPSQKDVDENLQLSLYHLGILKRWPHLQPEHIKLSLYYLKAGEKLSTTRDQKALEKTEKEILDTIETIEKKTEINDFPPVPSALCNWCGYKPICPAWRHLYERDKKSLPEKIEVNNMVTEYAKLKEEITEREKELKQLAEKIQQYLNQSGLERLFGDTVMITRKMQERTNFDTEKLRSILEPEGLWQEVLMPDPKRLKKLLPTLSQDLQEKIKEGIIIKKFATLSLMKRKSGDYGLQETVRS